MCGAYGFIKLALNGREDKIVTRRVREPELYIFRYSCFRSNLTAECVLRAAQLMHKDCPVFLARQHTGSQSRQQKFG